MILFRILVIAGALATIISCTREGDRSVFVFGRDPAPACRSSNLPSDILAHWQGTRRAPLVCVSPSAALGPEPTPAPAASGAGNGSFLRTAYRLGYAREIFWVIPSRLPGRDGLVTFLRRFPGVSEADIAALRYEEGIGHITVGGVPVTICTPKSLPRFTEPVLLHIDVTFFPVAASEYSSTSLETMKALFDELAFRELPVRKLSLSWGMDHDPADTLYRYLANELAEGVTKPPLFKQDKPPEEWLERDACDLLHRTRRPEKLAVVVAPLLEKRPDDPALLAFSVAALAETDRRGAAEKTLQRLTAIDGAYAPLRVLLDETATKRRK